MSQFSSQIKEFAVLTFSVETSDFCRRLPGGAILIELKAFLPQIRLETTLQTKKCRVWQRLGAIIRKPEWGA